MDINPKLIQITGCHTIITDLELRFKIFEISTLSLM